MAILFRVPPWICTYRWVQVQLQKERCSAKKVAKLEMRFMINAALLMAAWFFTTTAHMAMGGG